jgi:hypothetical protein
VDVGVDAAVIVDVDLPIEVRVPPYVYITSVSLPVTVWPAQVGGLRCGDAFHLRGGATPMVVKLPSRERGDDADAPSHAPPLRPCWICASSARASRW